MRRLCLPSGVYNIGAAGLYLQESEKAGRSGNSHSEKNEAKALSDGLADFRKKYVGKYFKGLKSGKIWKIDASGCGINVATGAYLSEYDTFKGWKAGEIEPCDPPRKGELPGSESHEQEAMLTKFFKENVSGRSTPVEPPQEPKEPQRSLKSDLSDLLRTKKPEKWEASSRRKPYLDAARQYRREHGMSAGDICKLAKIWSTKCEFCAQIYGVRGGDASSAAPIDQTGCQPVEIGLPVLDLP